MNLVDQYPDTKAYTHKGRDQAVLMIHGFTSTPNIFRQLAHLLSTVFGWEIRVPLLPGHGMEPKNLDTISDQDWIKSAEDEFEQLLIYFPKIHLVGLSLGGTLCAHLASRYPNNVSSLILLAPAMYVRSFFSRLALPMVRFFPTVLLRKWILRKNNPDISEKISYHHYSAASVIQFDAVCRKVKKTFCTSKPCLIFVPKNDLTIHPKSGKWFLKRSSNPKSKIVELDQSPHVVFLGKDNDNIFSEIKNFLAAT